MDTYRISIITITFNNLSGLKDTVNSVIKQDNCNYELIIIDGLSSDGTNEYLNSLNHDNFKKVSEKDNGIYDAMNKGINLAKGEWIIFMNAGDTFNSKYVLKDFILNDFKDDLIYGNCIIKYNTGIKRVSVPKPLNQLWKGMSFSHQSVFVRSNLMKSKRFNTKYKYCADFDFIFSLYFDNRNFHYWNYSISNIEAGGISDDKRYLATKEVLQVNQKINPSFKNYLYFVPNIIWGFLVVKIKSILPKKMVKKMTELKYK